MYSSDIAAPVTFSLQYHSEEIVPSVLLMILNIFVGIATTNLPDIGSVVFCLAQLPLFPPTEKLRAGLARMGPGAGCNSEVERSLMVRWVVGSILHGVDPLSYYSFQPVLHNWCNKYRGMCYPVCGMVHIKEPLLLIDKSSLCGGSGFPFSLSEWSLTICLTPYNRR